ncbi:hypothetical protein [Mycolicibacter arupensis]|uniref:hypothetical protein n=1 Tax=Mycolicibacter arupensis TaxID=342002 RepID=UPI00069AAC82|nr:hypothetical protein [Mycolicibacter arupensis]
MARSLDVSARLTEGREAIAHTQAYVSACHRLGYRQPGLTDYDGQLAEQFDSEAGLDLELLDADCAALAALADVAEENLRIQCRQLVELAAAWRGPGAEAAAEFLRRHCAAAERLTVRLRAAATVCGALRDDLWRWVDAKVTAVVRLDDRVGAQRPAWLAAARAISSGADDTEAATVIEHQVMPYVDNDVRDVWPAAMRSASEGISAAYDAAIAAAGPGAGVVFATPADLDPVIRPDLTGAVAPFPVVPITGPVDGPPAPLPQVVPAAPAKAVVGAAPAGLLDVFLLYTAYSSY